MNSGKQKINKYTCDETMQCNNTQIHSKKDNANYIIFISARKYHCKDGYEIL